MATSKKTTGNLVWIIFCCAMVLVAPKFFFSQTQDLSIELTTKNSHTCDVAEFFGGEVKPNRPPNYIRFAVGRHQQATNDPQQLKSVATLKKPFDVLRIDPCTRSGETVEITALTLTTPGKKLTFEPAELDLECTNCELKRTATKTLVVTAHSADSQLLVKNLDQQFLVHSNKFMQYYQKLQIVVVGIFVVAILWLVITLMQQQKTLLMTLTTSSLVALASFYVLYKKRLLLGFNLPFGDDVFLSGMAFMHHNMYSRYTDLVLYAVPLLMSLIVFVGTLWWVRRKT